MFSEINEAINFGMYQKARILISVLPEKYKTEGRLLRSRIEELNGYFDLAMRLADEAYQESLNSENLELTLRSSNTCLYALWRLRRFEEAEDLISRTKRSLSQTDENIQTTLAYATFLNVTGLILWSNNDLIQAKENFQKSLNIRKKHGDKLLISYSLNNLGNVELTNNYFSKAKKLYSQSMELRVELNCQPGIAASHNSFGRLFDKIGEFEEGENEHRTCIELWDEIGNIQFKAKACRFLAINQSHQKNYGDSKKYFELALKSFQAIYNTTDANLTRQWMSKFLPN